ncbi:glutathione S-transferase family protein [Niveispirillum sp.]|uniref:glutathione S-transferase family protein n=1 Tax=Niveispirillum sp. TaxID=1917217 RepID=UPI001B6FDE27|nr:glutathione S-transferase family protein [Niveispirillum sp.]MBP7335699.1 glutathione S-transferase family protein [Niveispirillum sp.]
MITLYACNFHGAFAHGTVRDIRARWALEEAGLAYETRMVGREGLSTPEYRAIHPFGKIPAIVEEDGLAIFESAAIVLHLGERSEVLLPHDRGDRARTTAWICAAATTLEWAVSTLGRIDFFPIDRDADATIRPTVVRVVQTRLAALTEALGDRDYLEGRFTGADIMMRCVLDMLSHTDLVAPYPTLTAYMDRCAARPAFQRAMRDHLAAYDKELA